MCYASLTIAYSNIPRRGPISYAHSLRSNQFLVSLTPHAKRTLTMASTTPLPPTTHRRLQILMLHGYTQSGPLFHAKTRALEKNLKKAFPPPLYSVSLVYPTGPITVRPADIPNYQALGYNTAPPSPSDESPDSYGWWTRKGDAEPYRYEGMELGFARVAETIRAEGPFDGVIGFSQGGALAGMVAALLEPGRREAFAAAGERGGMAFPAAFEEDTGYVEGVVQEPLRWAVSYSGFGATTNDLYRGFYEPKVATPMLHFLGSVDTVVEEARSLRLVDACVEGAGEGERRVVRHPGGHFLPSSQKQYVAALVGFIREIMGWDEGGGGKKKDVSDELDLPF